MPGVQKTARLTVLECALGILRDLDVNSHRAHDWEIGALVKERYDTNKDATFIYETTRVLREFIENGKFPQQE